MQVTQVRVEVLDLTGCLVFQNVPPDLAICCYILEQSLSVRALQEMLSNTSLDEVRQNYLMLD